MSKAEVLALPARFDAAVVATLWQAWRGSAPRSIDFAAVQEVDSAGLAFVASLCGLAGSTHGGPAPALVNVPDRFVQLCRAHRVDEELLS